MPGLNALVSVRPRGNPCYGSSSRLSFCAPLRSTSRASITPAVHRINAEPPELQVDNSLRGLSHQSPGSPGLNLTDPAITLWDIVYFERAVAALRVLRHLSPLRLQVTPAGKPSTMQRNIWPVVAARTRRTVAKPRS